MAPEGAPCFTVYNKFVLFLDTPNRCSLEKGVENEILFNFFLLSYFCKKKKKVKEIIIIIIIIIIISPSLAAEEKGPPSDLESHG